MSETTELTCQEVVELVTDYLSGAMSTSESTRFEQHLATCPGCTTYLAQMKTTLELAGQLREDSLADDAKRDLLDTFRRWKKS